MIIIIILAVISFPIAIYYDSKKRIGKPSWEWMILGLIFLLAGVVQGVKQLGELSGPLGSASIMGTIVGVWLGTFTFYRIATRNKAKKYREGILKESEFKFGEPAISSDETADKTISANQIVCDSCKTLNPISAKFCQTCGNPIIKLTVVCPNCNTSNSQTAKYCINCGKPLAQILQEIPVEVEKRRAPIEGPSKICPKCAEAIKIDVLVCNYCGNQFSEEEVKAEKEKYQKQYQEKVKQANNLGRRKRIRMQFGIPLIIVGTLLFLLVLIGFLSDISKEGGGKGIGMGIVLIVFISAPFIIPGILCISHAHRLQKELQEIQRDLIYKSLQPSELPLASLDGNEAFRILLKKTAGRAQNFAEVMGEKWLCTCGEINSYDQGTAIQNCIRCHANRDFVLTQWTEAAMTQEVLKAKQGV